MAVLVTTSRRPGRRSRSLVKDLVSVIPGAFRVTRGRRSLSDLAREALSVGADRVVVVGERRGNPGVIRVYEPLSGPPALREVAVFIVVGVKLAREAGAVGVVRPKYLLVKVGGDPVAGEVGEVFLRVFNARVYREDLEGESVVAEMEGLGGVVFVSFKQGGRLVGPVLKISRVIVGCGRPQC
ncbi:MAG: hypothetical protein P3X22_003155 [Thermoprotei archaeon]|nr:hypothetical protein [Thermoprotei archaeon]